MKDTELKEMRDRDLYETYVKAIREKEFASMGDAAEYARLQPASQFYLSARTASLLIGRIESYISLIDLNDMSRKRIWELYDRYVSYRKENPFSGLTRERILEELVEQPAPEYYLSQGRAKHIIMYERRKVRKKIMGC